MQKTLFTIISILSFFWTVHAWAVTPYGKFQFFIDGVNADVALLTTAGSPILPTDVPLLYGTPDGMTIYDDGIDVCSWAYVEKRNLMRPIKPIYQDLSDVSGWPYITVKADTVAIDPALGRFKFSDGVLNTSSISISSGDGEALLMWENISSSWKNTRIIRKENSYPNSPTDGVTVYNGLGKHFFDKGLKNNVTYYYVAFATDLNAQYKGKAIAKPQASLGQLNHVINGDFENGDNNNDGVGNNWSKSQWSPLNPQVTFNLNSSVAHSGTAAQEIYLAPGGLTTSALVAQVVELKENTNYTLLFWAKTEAASTINIYGIAPLFAGGNWYGAFVSSVSTNGVFAEVISSFQTPDNGGHPLLMNLSFVHDPTLGTSVFMDDVVLVEQTPPSLNTIHPVAKAHTGFGVPGHGSIKVQGNYAYMASGEGDFQVIDIADKTKPKVISYFPVEFNATIEVLGNVAYIQGNHGIKTLDISNPQAPVYLGGLQHPNLSNLPWIPSLGGNSEEIVVKNGYIYVTVSGRTTALYILDMTDPNNLVEVGRLLVPDSLGASELYINAAGDTAYLALNSGGGAVVDISIPTTPVLLGTYTLVPGEDPIYDKLRLIGVSGTTMIMASTWRPVNYQPSRSVKILLIDASNPATPVRRGVYSFGSNANPGSEMTLLKHTVANGKYIYVTDQNENSFGDLNRLMSKARLITFDISNLDSPLLVNEYIQQKPGRYTKLSLYGQFLYVNDYNYGMHIFDVSSPATPVVIGGTITAGEGHYAWVNDTGDLAFHTQTFGGSIFIIDVSDPTNPVKKGTYWDGEWNERSAFMGRGDYLYVPQHYDMAIIDVSNPNLPTKIGRFPGMSDLGDEQWPRLSLFGDYAFMTTVKRSPDFYNHYKQMLYVYDIRNPEKPLLQSSTEVIPDTLKGLWSGKIFAKGDYVYMTFPAENSLMVIDVSNPSLPHVTGSITDPNLTFYFYHGEAAGRLSVSNDIAYIVSANGNGQGGQLHMVDVSNPNSPKFLTSFDSQSQQSLFLGGLPQQTFRDIRISGKYLYTAGYGSYNIYALDNPVSPTLVANHSSYPYMTGWSSGPVLGEYVYSSALENLNIVRVIRDSQAMNGLVKVSVNTTATIADATSSLAITIAIATDTTSPVSMATATNTAGSGCAIGSASTFDASVLLFILLSLRYFSLRAEIA